MSEYKNLIGCLADASERSAGIRHITGSSNEHVVTYAKLLENARLGLGFLQSRGLKKGDELIFQIEDNNSFTVVFWSCVLGGIIPVPINSAFTPETRSKLINVWNTLSNPYIITEEKSYSSFGPKIQAEELKNYNEQHLLQLEDFQDWSAYEGDEESIEGGDVAFIQFSSGSTGSPKGVVLTHSNLLTNIKAIARCSNLTKEDSTLGWMPLTHDLGLIGFHLTPIYLGINQYLIPTSAFIRRPSLWLIKINEHRVSFTASPNFGYKHFMNFFKKEELAKDWDLSCIKRILNGAEPISAKLCHDFLAKLKRFGLSEKSMYPVYGMAEASLAVAFPEPGKAFESISLDRNQLKVGDDVRESEVGASFVCVGKAVDDCFVQISNDDFIPVEEGIIGHIEIKGGNVTKGYHNNPEANESAFTEDGWLRTGDLGFFKDEKLYITGRSKDIIFSNGQNLYPHDIERIVEELDEIELGKVVVCGCPNEDKHRDDILAFVLYKGKLENFVDLAVEIRFHVNRRLSVELDAIIPVRTIEKTTSGKVRRFHYAQTYSEGVYTDDVNKLHELILNKLKSRKRVEPGNALEWAIFDVWTTILKRDDIGIHENFFELGGNSLKANVVIGRVARDMKIELSIREVFKSPTISSLARIVKDKKEQGFQSIPSISTRNFYPCSSVQQRMYVLHKLDPEGLGYNITAVRKLTGTLDEARLSAAFDLLMNRHQILRTYFADLNGELVQKVAPINKVGLEKLPLVKTVNETIGAFVKPFVISEAPLFRIGLIEESAEVSYLIFDIHHIIADGFSLNLIVQELGKLYAKLPVEDATVSYIDFSVWQEKFHSSKQMANQKAYWLDQFSDYVPTLNFPTDFERKIENSTNEGGCLTFELDHSIYEGMVNVATDNNSTFYTLFITTLYITLSKYTNQEDIVIGTPISNRPHIDLQNVFGPFINTLALRGKPSGEKSIAEFHEEVKELLLNNFENQAFPFEQLIEELDIARDVTRNALFDVLFVFQNANDEELELEGLKIQEVSYFSGHTKLDLNIHAMESNEGFKLRIEYAMDLFKKESIDQFGSHFISTLQCIIDHYDQKIKNIDYLSGKESKYLIEKVNETHQNQAFSNALEMFENSVSKYPSEIASQTEGKQLTYQELDLASNFYASRLLELGVRKGDFIGIRTLPGNEVLIAMMATWKVGAAFVPIDPGIPEDRSNFIMQDSGLKLLFADQESAGIDIACEIIDAKNQSKEGGWGVLGAEDVAYVIYTSGTTGNPKGTQIKHGSLSNYVQWLNKSHLSDDEAKRSVMLTSYAFDLGYTSLFGMLLLGGTMNWLSEEHRKDPAYVVQFLLDNEITFVKTTPSQLFSLVNATNTALLVGSKSLKTIFIGGEAIQVRDLKRLNELNPNIQFVNHYGPTEATIGCVVHAINDLEKFELDPIIGSPIDNVQAFVLDKDRKVVPIGVEGELCIAGAGLSSGYLNRNEEYIRKFHSHPYEENKQIYATGDIVKRRPDGALQFIGRNDDQIKIRGYRVELKGIESRIKEFEWINDAVILNLQDKHGTDFLCAYVVGDLEENDLRLELKELLPEYMIPTHIMSVPGIPMNENGKLDKTRLPYPSFAENQHIVLPENEIQQVLSDIWKDILEVNRSIGIHENFFDLGGHSLKATMVIAQIHKNLDVEIPLRAFFAHPTIYDLEKELNKLEKNVFDSIPRVEVQPYYPVSSAQKRMYVLSELEGNATSYNMPGAFWVTGPLDYDRLGTAFEGLINKHESLRTSFKVVDGEPFQEVHDSFRFKTELLDETEVHKTKGIDGLIRHFIRPFDLSTYPLIRLGIYKEKDEKHLILFDIHHIVSDGSSMGLIIRDFISLYDEQKTNILPVQYKDYAVWQQEAFKTTSWENQRNYWIKQFSNSIPVLDLPTDFSRPKVQSFNGETFTFQFDKNLVAEIRKLCEQHQLTMFMSLSAIYSILLKKLTGQEELVIGTPVAGRQHADLKDIIGVFLNMLPLKMSPESQKPLSEYLQEVKKVCLGAYDNQGIPYDEVIESLEVPRVMNRNPLFDTMLVVQNMDLDELKTNDLTFEQHEFDLGSSQLDLSIIVFENSDSLDFTIQYSTSLFTRSTIETFVERLKFVAQQVVSGSNKRLGQFELVDAKEKERLLNDFQGTKLDIDYSTNVIDLIKNQVAKNPKHAALVHNDAICTYQELDQRSSLLANVLIDKKVGKGSVVPVILGRSTDTILSLLAIVKTGGAYVFIDPDYPKARIDFMLKDSNAEVIITSIKLKETLTLTESIDQIYIDSLDWSSEIDGNLERSIKSSDLAYLVYTSGSTGTPKGVKLTHQNLLAFVQWSLEEFKDTDFEIVYNATSYSFDLSIFEIFYSLSAGKTIRILENGLEIPKYIDQDEKVLLNTVPVVIKEVLERNTDLRNVVAINMAGEPISQFVKDKLNLEAYEVRNLYGPSEDTTYSTFHQIQNSKSIQNIGKPIANTTAYVLDKDNCLAPIGLPGELCLAGDCVAEGYFNQEVLTNEKFVKDDWSSGRVMYRTGDLVRWMDNGELEYLGRIDDQIKIRGFRIELKEIEQKLLEHKEVVECVVIDLKDDETNDTILCAYYVTVQNEQIESKGIRSQLSKMLPAYMIPNRFMQLEALPLTPNGKVDKRALPFPENKTTRSESETPQTETAKWMAEVWKSILNIDQIHSNSNFFESGGHSLHAMQVVSRIGQEWNVEASIRTIFEHPELQDLADWIDELKSMSEPLKKVHTPIPNADIQTYYPLSSSQNRIYVLEQFRNMGTAYNMPGALNLYGRIEIKKLESAFKTLIRRHESLRTSFHMHGEQPVQKIHNEVEFSLEKLKGDVTNITAIYNEFVKPFDLESDSLFEVGLLQVSPEHHVLMYNMHHIISDGLSISNLLSEFFQLYQKIELPSLSHQYKDFAVWQQTNNEEGHASYWKEQFLSNRVPILELPYDFQRPKTRSHGGGLVQFSIDSTLEKHLGEYAQKQQTTIFNVMLATFKLLLAKYSNQNDIVIGTPVAGRSNVSLENIVGMFVNTLAIRSSIENEKSFDSYLAELKNTMHDALDHQNYPFEELVAQLELERDVSRNPLFDVMFSYEELSGESFEMEGIQVEALTVDRKVSKFDLTMQVLRLPDETKISLAYATDSFNESTVQRFKHHFNGLLTQITKRGNEPISALNVVLTEEKGQIHEFEQGVISSENQPKRSIVSIFESIALENAGSNAVVFEGEQLTYDQLNRKANQLARTITVRNKYIPIISERTLETVVAILAVLKSGNAFVPIDPSYPKERIEGILEDLDANLILIQTHLKDLYTNLSKNVEAILIDDKEYQSKEDDNLDVVPEAQSTAYIIYTSGSTGKPKGVLLSHANLINYVDWFLEFDKISNSDKTTVLHSFGFDGSFTNIFGSLLSGGEMHLIPRNYLLETSKLLSYIQKNEITYMKFTPTMFSSLVNNPDFVKIQCTSLRHVMLGGESIQIDDVQKFHAQYPTATIINHYGPTETTIGSIAEKIDFDNWSTYKKQPSIGKPITNTTCFILDENKNQVGIGMVGELYIKGAGVGIGYLNRDALNAERFISNPMDSNDSEKVYRTGDLAKWLPDGRIIFCGRQDDQVKIRGYRIELGEIEGKLLERTDYSESKVIHWTNNEQGDGDGFLCAYIVSKEELDLESLRNELNQHLPDYMVPSYFVRLDEMPLNSSGKLDKKQLQRPDIASLGSAEYLVPSTEAEAQLAIIWQQVLGVERVGGNDNFFHLGGDSIKAIQVAARLNSRGFLLEVQEIFNQPRLKDMAGQIIEDVRSIDQSEVTGTGALGVIQNSFLSEYRGNKDHFNQAVLIHAKEHLDVETLQKVWLQLITHHDALRSSFLKNIGRQEILSASDISFNINEIEIEETKDWKTNLKNYANQRQEGLSIQENRLIDLSVIQTPDGPHLLMILHHLIVDGVSWRIILEDFTNSYQQLSAGLEIQLPPKTHSFLQWSEELQEMANSDQFVANDSHWNWIKEEPTEQTPLFEGKEATGTINKKVIEFSEELTTKLLNESNKAFNTQINDLLLSALASTVFAQTGKVNPLIMLEGHGREQILPKLDVSRTVGWFTTKYPVQLSTNQHDLERLIIDTKEMLRMLPMNGIGYGMYHKLTDSDLKDASQELIFPKILFNYLGQFDQNMGNGIFEKSELSSGENKERNTQEFPLQINGRVRDARLSFDFEAYDSILTAAELDSWTNDFKVNLSDLVALCTSSSTVVQTPSDYKLTNVTFDQLTKIKKDYSDQIESIYPLSPMQQGMLFVNLLEGKDEAYFEQTLLTLSGDLSKDRVEKVFNKLVARHEIIRTNVVYEDLEAPHTVISKEKYKELLYKDISSFNVEEQRSIIVDHQKRSREFGFNLQTDLLMDMVIFKLSENEHKLAWNHHHIIMDGWCLGILLEEFFQYYRFGTDGPFELPMHRAYGDYIHWIEKQNKFEAIDYWKNVVSEVDEKVEIPGKLNSLKFGKKDKSIDKMELILDKELNQELNVLAKNNELTVFNIIQTLWGVVLQKYNHTDSAIFGSVISGRPADLEGVEQIVGLFINTIPVHVGKAENFVELAKSVQNQFITSNQYGYLPLNEIQNLSELKGDLIDHILVFENYPLDENAVKLNNSERDIEITGVERDEITNYDFSITIIPGDVLKLVFKYNQNVYEGDQIRNLRKAFDNALRQLVSKPESKIESIQLGTEEDEQKVLLDFNKTKIDYRSEATLHQLFEEQAGRTPEHPALWVAGKSLTYKELNEKSNQLARRLVEAGVKSNQIVGIKLERSIEMIVGIFGVLKAGAAYLPLDPDIPEERLKFILKDSSSPILLTDKQVDFDSLKGSVKLLNMLDGEAIFHGDSSNLNIGFESTNLAYVIYTSGSTGHPKGVLINHKNASNLLTGLDKDIYSLYSEEGSLNIALVAAFIFDASIKQIFAALSFGHTLYVIEDAVKEDPERWMDFYTSNKIHITDGTPSLLKVINHSEQQFDSTSELKHFIIGGEALPAETVINLLKKFPKDNKPKVTNIYGPTECTVDATSLLIDPYFLENFQIMPIGKPMANHQTYILDSNLNILPPGVVGELHIAGEGLARGYLNNEVLTNEKFIVNPFSSESDRLYKTGDLAQWRPDGNIEFVGRIDHQVKIRGFRIELGDIESQLKLQTNEVSEAAVIDRLDDNGNKFLCAYLVSTEELNIDEIKTALKKELPDYMIPSHYMRLDQLPLNSSGKLNRKALPAPDDSNVDKATFEAPVSEVQIHLANAWQEVLGLNLVGLNDNFFSLGGDSIKAIMVVSKIKQHNLVMEMKDLFAYPTIIELAPFVKTSDHVVNQDPVIGEFDYSPIQMRFFETGMEVENHYNQTVMLESTQKVNQTDWEQVLTKIMLHHDVLRSQFDKGTGIQIIKEEATEEKKLFLSQYVEVESEAEIPELANEIQASLDIKDGPLLASAIFNTADQCYVLITIHHLVVDGVSWRILLEDINLLLNQKELPLKTQSFMSWSQRLHDHAQSLQMEKEIPYWNEIESKFEASWDNTNNTHGGKRTKQLAFSKENTKKLLEEVNEAYNTEINDIFLAALNDSLEVVTGKQTNVVFLEGHGRESLFENQDISRTIGWFTSIFPVALDNVSQGDIGLGIKRTKETLRKIPNKGIGYGILRYLNNELKENNSFKATTEITFNYLGQFSQLEGGQFSRSSLKPGDAVAPINRKQSTMDISGIITDEVLNMSFSYNPSALGDFKMEQFIQTFEQKLIQIIQYCSQKEEMEITVSDVGFNIGEDDFDSIFS